LGLTWNIFYYFDRCLPWELAVHVRSFYTPSEWNQLRYRKM
jgi:hypothetical protein